MHGMGFCCCSPAGCDYFTDEFTGADDTSLGSNWVEDAGDWSRTSNQLQVSTADAIIRCTVTHPTSGTAYRVSVLMQGGQEGDQLRAWINNDPTTFGEITYHTNGSTGRARLRLFVAGVLKGETDIYAPPGRQHSLNLCTGGSHIAIGLGETLYLSAPVTITSSVCGLATGTLNGTTPAKFDNFKLSKDASDDATCPACGESCTYFAENFTGDATSQSPALSPVSLNVVRGSWVWSAYYWLMQTSSANALLLTPALDNPDGTSHRLLVDAIGVSSTGASTTRLFRIVADYVDDDNYLFVEGSITYWPPPFFGGFWTITWSFYKRAVGVNSLVGSYSRTDFGPLGTLQLIVGATQAWAIVPATNLYPAKCIGKVAHTPSTIRGGIATAPANTETFLFRLIQLLKHSDTDSACTTPTCPGGSTCSHCSGTTPSALDLTIASMASDASCNASDPGGCLLWNDTFRVAQDGSDPCLYTYTAGGTPGACSPHHIEATFSDVGGQKRLDVWAYADAAETKYIHWFQQFTAPFNCAGLSGTNLTKIGQTVCGGSPTCQATAVT